MKQAGAVAEAMTEKCVFCKIMGGEKYQPVIYHDGLCTAFMDINQPNPYHVLIVPNSHAEDIYALSADEASAIFQLSARLSHAIRRVTNCPGLNVLSNNGRVAGQTVFHFHLHLMPRFQGDRLRLAAGLMGRKYPKTDAELERMTSNLKDQLAKSE